jgi:hypothetical protein
VTIIPLIRCLGNLSSGTWRTSSAVWNRKLILFPPQVPLIGWRLYFQTPGLWTVSCVVASLLPTAL